MTTEKGLTHCGMGSSPKAATIAFKINFILNLVLRNEFCVMNLEGLLADKN